MIETALWLPADGIRLEPNALSAATLKVGHSIVTAGPGAGKTELLAQRADFLLRTGISPYPRRILAISFKVDAAQNLRDRVQRRVGAQLASRFDSFTFHAFAKRLIDNYRVELTGQWALDADYQLDPKVRIERRQITFNDLVPFGIEILQSTPFAVRGLRQTYSHVFLDEFQDATEEQYTLVREAFGGSKASITAVGDDKQRIMAWAGALEGIMQQAAEDLDATVLGLYQNFRSAPVLRRMQNRMIAEMEPGAEVPEADLGGEEGTVEILDFETDADEADTLADLIQGWVEEGVPLGEIAVLVRQQPQFFAAPLMSALSARGVPVRNDFDRQDLAAEPVAALIFNFLRVVSQGRQPGAYAELMQVFDTHEDSDERVLQLDRAFKRFLSETASDVQSTTWDSSRWPVTIEAFLAMVTDPVLTSLSAAYRQGSRLREVVDEATSAFMESLSHTGNAVDALSRLSDAGAVRILTIHKSKGLEFEKVILLGMETETFWGKDRRELRSIFFVGVSRAKRELTMTVSRHRARPPGAAYWHESRKPHWPFLNYAKEA